MRQVGTARKLGVQPAARGAPPAPGVRVPAHGGREPRRDGRGACVTTHSPHTHTHTHTHTHDPALLLRGAASPAYVRASGLMAAAAAVQGNLLHRAVAEMRHVFALAMETSDREQKLSWEFARALDAASRKGRVILVIGAGGGGLHAAARAAAAAAAVAAAAAAAAATPGAVVTAAAVPLSVTRETCRAHADGAQSLTSPSFPGLKWLPLTFPSNVRVVLSVTVSAEDVKFVAGQHGGGEFFLTQVRVLCHVNPEYVCCMPMFPAAAAGAAAAGPTRGRTGWGGRARRCCNEQRREGARRSRPHARGDAAPQVVRRGPPVPDRGTSALSLAWGVGCGV